jgi:hypothetical protein
MLQPLMLVSLTCMGVCGAVSLAAIKRTIPITIEDAKVMWTLHRQNSNCKCRKWRPLKHKKGKIIGFQCECGYKYKQKKPLIC